MNRNQRQNTKHPERVGKGKTFDRETVLNDLHEMLVEMHDKVVHGRMRDKQSFSLKLQALKAYSYSASVFSSILDASENSDVLDRLTELEGGREHDKRKK
jgi:hypothetical protein